MIISAGGYHESRGYDNCRGMVVIISAGGWLPLGAQQRSRHLHIVVVDLVFIIGIERCDRVA